MRGCSTNLAQQEELVGTLLGVLVAGALHLLQMNAVQLEFLWHREQVKTQVFQWDTDINNISFFFPVFMQIIIQPA